MLFSKKFGLKMMILIILLFVGFSIPIGNPTARQTGAIFLAIVSCVSLLRYMVFVVTSGGFSHDRKGRKDNAD